MYAFSLGLPTTLHLVLALDPLVERLVYTMVAASVPLKTALLPQRLLLLRHVYKRRCAR